MDHEYRNISPEQAKWIIERVPGSSDLGTAIEKILYLFPVDTVAPWVYGETETVRRQKDTPIDEINRITFEMKEAIKKIVSDAAARAWEIAAASDIRCRYIASNEADMDNDLGWETGE